MQTVRFKAGDTILSEGEAGDTAFLITAGSVEVSIGAGAAAEDLGTLGAGDVFGEMSLIEPGPRSATVKAVTDVECFVTTYDAFLASAQTDPEQRGRADADAGPPAAADERADRQDEPGTGHRIQQWLHVILAGLDEQDALSARGDGDPAARAAHAAADRAVPDRRRRGRQGRGGARLHAAPEDRGLPEPLVRQVRADRPGDLEPVRRRRGAGLARALRPLGAQRRASAAPRRARHHARPVPPQHVPRHAGDVRLRRALPRAGEARAAGRASGGGCGRSSGSSSASRSPIPRRSRTSTSAWRSGAGRWRSWRRTIP